MSKLKVRVMALPERPTEFDLSVLMADHVNAQKAPGEFGKYRMFRGAIKQIAQRDNKAEIEVKENEIVLFRTEWQKPKVEVHHRLNQLPKLMRTDHEAYLKHVAEGGKTEDAPGFKLIKTQVNELYSLHIKGKFSERDERYATLARGEKPLTAVRSLDRDVLSKAMDGQFTSTILNEGLRFAAGDSTDLDQFDNILNELGIAAMAGDEARFLAQMEPLKHQLETAELAQSKFLAFVSGNGSS
jgi:hypothetical protein